jgi:AMMECR1 domain-containing protein
VGFGEYGVIVARNNGDGTFQPTQLVITDFGGDKGWGADKYPRSLTDLNGDGRPEIVGFGEYGVIVARNNGDGTFRPTQMVIADFGGDKGWGADKYPRSLTDLNGDGRPEVVGFGEAGVYVARNNGDGTFQPTQMVNTDFGADKGWGIDKYPRHLTDLNGDGRPEIVGFGEAGVYVARNNGDGAFQPTQMVIADFGNNRRW